MRSDAGYKPTNHLLLLLLLLSKDIYNLLF